MALLHHHPLAAAGHHVRPDPHPPRYSHPALDHLAAEFAEHLTAGDALATAHAQVAGARPAHRRWHRFVEFMLHTDITDVERPEMDAGMRVRMQIR